MGGPRVARFRSRLSLPRPDQTHIGSSIPHFAGAASYAHVPQPPIAVNEPLGQKSFLALPSLQICPTLVMPN